MIQQYSKTHLEPSKMHMLEDEMDQDIDEETENLAIDEEASSADEKDPELADEKAVSCIQLPKIRDTNMRKKWAPNVYADAKK